MVSNNLKPNLNNLSKEQLVEIVRNHGLLADKISSNGQPEQPPVNQGTAREFKLRVPEASEGGGRPAKVGKKTQEAIAKASEGIDPVLENSTLASEVNRTPEGRFRSFLNTLQSGGDFDPHQATGMVTGLEEKKE